MTTPAVATAGPAPASTYLTPLRRLFVRAPQAQPVALGGRRMLVTGAAPDSIGFETARALAAWGADVVVTTRRATDAVVSRLAEALAGVPGAGRVSGHALDLCDAGSVERFVAWYRRTQGDRLDVLVNNAGVHLDLLSEWKAPTQTADGHEIHWRTNYLGTMHLTRRLLPLLLDTARMHGEARVVTVVSQLHARGRNAGLSGRIEPYHSWVAYGTSKLALVHASFELQRRYGAQGLRASCLHPGAVYTNIATHGLAGHPRLAALRRRLAPLERFFLLTPEEGAQTTLHCATHADAGGGTYYRACAPAAASAETADRDAAARLWDETGRWLQTLPAAPATA